MINEKISVIVPVYNCEKYVEKCVNSLLHQTYKNLEIIIVNDGSTDDSEKICTTIMESDKRILLINQNNGGLSVARNVGLKNASGQYVFFCDSDDFLSETLLESLYSFTKENDLDLVEGHTSFFCNNKISEYANIDKDLSYKSDKDTIYEFALTTYNRVNAWNKLIRKEILVNNGIEFQPGQVSEDYIWYFSKVLPCIRSVGYCTKGTYYYRTDNANSITKRYKENSFENYMGIYDYLIKDKQLMGYCKKYKTDIFSNLMNCALNASLCFNNEKNIKSIIKEIKINRKIMYVEKKLSKKSIIFNIIKIFPVSIAKEMIKLLFKINNMRKGL